MTVTMNTAPLDASREAARAGGMSTSKPGSHQDLSDHPQPEIAAAGIAAAPAGAAGTGRYDYNEGDPISSSRRDMLPPPGTSQFQGMGGLSTAKITQQVMGNGKPTADKLARGIVAIGSMSAAAITRTATAVGGAIHNYSNNLMNQIPPLSQPLTVSQSYVSRLRMVQRFSQPAAYAADVMAQYAGELLFWIMTAALAVYHQLASMKVLPQIAAGGKVDEAGVPVNPVRGGLPMATDELAAFKLVGAALLMAYVEVYDALEEAAQLLFRQASESGQRYLAHRHGGEAADVAAAALSVAADVMTLTLNWFRLMGRAFFSKTATSTARSYLLKELPDLHLE